MGTPHTSRHGPRPEALRGGILYGVDPGLWHLVAYHIRETRVGRGKVFMSAPDGCGGLIPEGFCLGFPCCISLDYILVSKFHCVLFFSMGLCKQVGGDVCCCHTG